VVIWRLTADQTAKSLEPELEFDGDEFPDIRKYSHSCLALALKQRHPAGLMSLKLTNVKRTARSNNRNCYLAQALDDILIVVAGAGFEPTTFGL
jgi:hypothetical protein